jgi:alpha/beta superfamily hydrolase
VEFWQGIPAIASQPWIAQLPNMPYVLAGFSFGTYVSSRLVAAMKEDLPQKLILVGTARENGMFLLYQQIPSLFTAN